MAMDKLLKIETGCQLVTRAPLTFYKTETTVVSFPFKDTTIKHVLQNGSNRFRAAFEQKTRGFMENRLH
jgi:hypothetical protein